MPFVPTSNAVMLELLYTWDGQLCENVLHYVKSAPWDLLAMDELAEGVKTIWNASVKASMPSNLSLDLIRVTDISSQTGPVLTFSTGLPIAGTHASPSLPNNCAMVITKRTAMRGRSFRGRLYLPGLKESDVTANTINLTFASALANAFETMIIIDLPVTEDEGLMVVNSTFFEGQYRSAGVATLVTSMDANQIVDSQRRRLPGRGS